MKKLPEQLADPVAILKSATQKDSFVVLTQWADLNGNPVVIPIHPNKQSTVNLENVVPTAYRKGSISRLLGENNKNVLWTKENESIEQLLTIRLQLPQEVAADTLVFNYSIPKLEQSVNETAVPQNQISLLWMTCKAVAGNQAKLMIY